MLDIEEQLLCSEVQDEANEKFDNLMNSFESFASTIQAISLQVKCKNQQVSSDSWYYMIDSDSYWQRLLQVASLHKYIMIHVVFSELQ